MKPYYQDNAVTIYHGDCREIVPTLGKFNLLLTDPPYGTTNYHWDHNCINDNWWKTMKGKCLGRIIMTSSLPFTIEVINSNKSGFKYWWIWNKTKIGNFIIAKHQPLRATEEILIFEEGPYYPIMRDADPENIRPRNISYDSGNINSLKSGKSFVSKNRNENKRFPVNLININSSENECNGLNRYHPTQKPEALFKYLIQTYSLEGESILDPFAGSGTTGRAAKDLGRKATLIEREERYCEIAAKRMQQEVLAL